MRTLKFIYAVLFFILIPFSCSEGLKERDTKEKMRTIVQRQNALLEDCFKTGNVEKLAALYTDSAKLSPDGADFFVGREKIKEFWKKDFETSKLVDMKTNVLTTDGNENLIYETGKTTTETLYKDSVYTFKVKYINVWKKQPDGNYKLDVDFWNKDE